MAQDMYKSFLTIKVTKFSNYWDGNPQHTKLSLQLTLL